jgi:hypothetical protein
MGNAGGPNDTEIDTAPDETAAVAITTAIRTAKDRIRFMILDSLGTLTSNHFNLTSAVEAYLAIDIWRSRFSRVCMASSAEPTADA